MAASKPNFKVKPDITQPPQAPCKATLTVPVAGSQPAKIISPPCPATYGCSEAMIFLILSSIDCLGIHLSITNFMVNKKVHEIRLNFKTYVCVRLNILLLLTLTDHYHHLLAMFYISAVPVMCRAP